MTGTQVAVWAATAAKARRAARQLAIAPSKVLPLGNRSAGAMRGRVLDRVLILPGATGVEVERNLRIATRTAAAVQWLDLRPAAAAVTR